MEEVQIIIYVIGGIVVFIGLVIYLAIMFEKKRTKAIKDSALRMGFSFEEKKETTQVTTKFDIFNIGYSKKIRNYMAGRKQQVAWEIFDYKYTTGGGKSQHSYNLTIFHARLQKKLPVFKLTREHLFHKMAAAVGYNDIDFEQYPKFSKKYFLKSPDQNIKSIFTPSIIQFFEHNDIKRVIEANAEDIIVYGKYNRMKPRDFSKTYEEIRRLVQLFA